MSLFSLTSSTGLGQRSSPWLMFLRRSESWSQARDVNSSSSSSSKSPISSSSIGPFSRRSSAKQLELSGSSGSFLISPFSSSMACRARDRALPGKLALKLSTSLFLIEASLSSRLRLGAMATVSLFLHLQKTKNERN